jgi:hypothetical protein
MMCMTVQNSIIPAAAAAVSNTQSNMITSSSTKAENGASGLTDAQFVDQTKCTSPCTAQEQQEDNGSADDVQMVAFRGVLRVVLVVLECCLCLAGFPVPGTPQPEGTVYGATGERGKEGRWLGSKSSYYDEKLVAQSQGWCSCMAVMWRSILDYLASGVLRCCFHVAAHAAVQVTS